MLTRLTPDEQARLETIRRKTEEVRNELRHLVLDFRARKAVETDVLLDSDQTT